MKKGLTPEDAKLWKANTRDVKPLSKLKPKEEPEKSKKKPVIKKPTIPTKPKPTPPPPIPQLRGLARKERRHITFDSQVDLHGLSLKQAYDVLERFLAVAQDRGFKTVLIITGKGSIHTEQTLRHQLPRWVEHTPLQQLVTFIEPAKPQDGGAGAFYVGIRRTRKKN